MTTDQPAALHVEKAALSAPAAAAAQSRLHTLASKALVATAF